MYHPPSHVLSIDVELNSPFFVTSLGDGQVAVLNGLLRACGRQGVGAACNVVSYWLVGLPAAYLLGFKAGLGVRGLWAAPAISIWVQALVLHVGTATCLDWEREAERAVRLAKQEDEGAGGEEVLLLDGAEGVEGLADAAVVARGVGGEQEGQRRSLLKG